MHSSNAISNCSCWRLACDRNEKLYHLSSNALKSFYGLPSTFWAILFAVCPFHLSFWAPIPIEVESSLSTVVSFLHWTLVLPSSAAAPPISSPEAEEGYLVSLTDIVPPRWVPYPHLILLVFGMSLWDRLQPCAWWLESVGIQGWKACLFPFSEASDWSTLSTLDCRTLRLVQNVLLALWQPIH